MKLFVALSLAALAYGLPQQQQLTFLPPTTLSLLSPALQARLEALPAAHSTRLASHIASLPEQRLVQLEEGGEKLEISEGEKSLLVFAGVKFVDVTEERAPLAHSLSMQKKESYPSKLAHSAASLKSAFVRISTKDMSAFLDRFTAFYTRYYRSPTGRESQLFLLGHLQELHEKLNSHANVTIREFEHTWGQNTIILRFEPPSNSSVKGVEKVVLLSAHQGSTNSLPFLRAPGADDDGSGVTVLLSVLSSLLAEGYAPTTHALEFHFYSAEEGGLLGSGEVARAYEAEGKSIRAVFHMDVVAFVKQGTKPRIGVISDNIDEGLTDFMRLLITEYAEIDYVDTKCGYACSDHSSWQKLGFPAACLAEGKFEDTNTHMHSSQDVTTIPEYSLDHMAQFARVGIAYAVELAGMEK